MSFRNMFVREATHTLAKTLAEYLRIPLVQVVAEAVEAYAAQQTDSGTRVADLKVHVADVEAAIAAHKSQPAVRMGRPPARIDEDGAAEAAGQLRASMTAARTRKAAEEAQIAQEASRWANVNFTSPDYDWTGDEPLEEIHKHLAKLPGRIKFLSISVENANNPEGQTVREWREKLERCLEEREVLEAAVERRKGEKREN